MELRIAVELKNNIGKTLPLGKPGQDVETEYHDFTSLENYAGFKKVCESASCHTAEDMTGCAALLFEMQRKNNVPDEYVSLSEKLSQLVKDSREANSPYERDYVFFAYEIMRELSRNEDLVKTEILYDERDVQAIASHEDDISVIAVVNNSRSEYFAAIEISGLPGRCANIDYYMADEAQPLDIMCKTDTKFTETKIKIPVSPYSLHLFKIR